MFCATVGESSLSMFFIYYWKTIAPKPKLSDAGESSCIFSICIFSHIKKRKSFRVYKCCYCLDGHKYDLSAFLRGNSICKSRKYNSSSIKLPVSLGLGSIFVGIFCH
ncbi:unnamed protein product [Amoebophrya sp. A120]|nr:unnamed protein product [Amoebophrya sp. A120]|eukprot:GSA120T00025514001.1